MSWGRGHLQRRDMLNVALQVNGCGHAPIRLGNICSLSILPCTQVIKCSIYSGADIFVGRLKFSESCHKYSNLHDDMSLGLRKIRPASTYSSVAFISGHVCGEQNSVIEP